MADQHRRNYEDELRRAGRRSGMERSGEEVRSWFSSDDPRVRRGNDERDDRFPYGGDRDRNWRDQGDGTYERGVARWRGADRGPEQRYLGGRDFERERYDSSPWSAGRGDDRGGWDESGDWDRGYGRREWPERRDGQWSGGGFGPGNYGPSGFGTGRRGPWQGGAREQDDYTGRGPKDYRRSDDRIREEVSDRLTDDYGVDASNITVQVKDGEVTLTGSVTTREQKRRAENLAEATSGVREVTNTVRVNRNDTPERELTQQGPRQRRSTA